MKCPIHDKRMMRVFDDAEGHGWYCGECGFDWFDLPEEPASPYKKVAFDFSAIIKNVLAVAVDGLNHLEEPDEMARTLATIITTLQDEGFHPVEKSAPPEPIPAENPPGGIPFMKGKQS